MKRFLLLSAFALSLCDVAHAQMTLQQQMEANRKAALASCDPGKCVQGYQTPRRDIERANAYLAQQDELHLRLMGMTPDTARKGIWGSAHKQDSMCAFYIRRLLGDYDGRFREIYGSDQDVIIRIERSGMCERRNLSIRP